MADTTQLSIRLPNKAVEMIEEDLIPTGLYGTSRAEVCKALILARLEQLLGEGIVTARRA
jgi:Arc/MetJ-type ribon-helix-helix transcriptional regulator